MRTNIANYGTKVEINSECNKKNRRKTLCPPLSPQFLCCVIQRKILQLLHSGIYQQEHYGSGIFFRTLRNVSKKSRYRRVLMLFPLFCIPLVLVRNRILNENKNFFSKIHRIHRLRTHTYHVLTPPPPAGQPAESGALQPQQALVVAAQRPSLVSSAAIGISKS